MRKPRAMIFNNNEMILNILAIFFSEREFEVLIFKDPIVCPVFEEHFKGCAKEKLCADILIIDFEMSGINGIELLQRQSQRGCRLDIRNKAVISVTMDMDEGYKKIIDKLDCAFFRKPLRLSELSEWIDEREKHMDLSQPLSFI